MGGDPSPENNLRGRAPINNGVPPNRRGSLAIGVIKTEPDSSGDERSSSGPSPKDTSYSGTDERTDSDCPRRDSKTQFKSLTPPGYTRNNKGEFFPFV